MALVSAAAFALPLFFLLDTYDALVLPKVLLATGIVLGLAARLFLEAARRPSLPPVRISPIDRALAVLIASAVVSTVASADPVLSIFGAYGRYDGLASVLLTSALFWLAFQESGRRRREVRDRVLTAIVAAGAVAGVWAIGQFIFGQSLDPAFSVGDRRRGDASFGNPNALAAFLALATPLALGRLSSVASRLSAALGVIAAVAVMAGLVVTFSRSGWLGGLIGGGVVMATFRGGRPRLLLPIAVIACVAAVTAVLWLFIDMRLADSTSVVTRIDIWTRSVELALGRPLLGYGLDSPASLLASNRTDLELDAGHAHSELMQVLVSQGVTGLVAYGYLQIRILRALRLAGSVALSAYVAYMVVVQLSGGDVVGRMELTLLLAATLPGQNRLVAGLGRTKALNLTLVLVMATALGPCVLRPYVADRAYLEARFLHSEGERARSAASLERARTLAPERRYGIPEP